MFFCSLIIRHLSPNLLHPVHVTCSFCSSCTGYLIPSQVRGPGRGSGALALAVLSAWNALCSHIHALHLLQPAEVAFSTRPALITLFEIISLHLTTLPIPSPALTPDTFHAHLIPHGVPLVRVSRGWEVCSQLCPGAQGCPVHVGAQ